jgi:hypothetical protein
MMIARAIATAMFAGLAIAATGTAWADPEIHKGNQMSGHYIGTATASNGQTVTTDWYFTPCGDGCASVATAPGGQPYAQARLVNGQWTEDETNNAVCSDGTVVPNALSAHYTWDPNTLAGTSQNTHKLAACGDPAGYQYTNNFQLRQAP